ncbi:MAG: peptidoglycan-binding domain-containing protein, partial [Candidatus Paceibacterota bacterium]
NLDPATRVAASGAGAPGSETTYFGSLTLAAVKAFQAKHGIITTGYVGPLTRAQLNALYCTPTTTTTAPGETTTTTVAATEGYFTYKLLPTPTNGTDVKKGDTNKAVMAFTLKANNSNINVQSVRLNFNKRPWLSVNKIALYEGNNLLKEVDAVSSAFEEAAVGSSYNLYLTGLNTSIPSGETKTFTVKIDVPSSPVNTDLSQVQLAGNSIRGVDTAGLNVYSPSEPSTRIFSIATATKGYINVSLNEASPVEGTALISNTETTEDVTLGLFDLEAEYRNVRVTDLIFDFTGLTRNNMDDVLSAAKLYDGSTLLATAALGSDASTTTGTVNFADLDISIAKDSTKTLTLKANVAKIDSSYTTAGDHVIAELDGTDYTNITAEDDLYNTLGNTELDGTATAEKQYFYKEGPTFALIQATEARSDSSSSSPRDVGDFSIKFSITANGSDIYLPTVDHATYSSTNTDDNGILQAITPAGDTASATTTYWSCEGTNSLDDLSDKKVWGIPRGSTRNCTFELNIVNTNARAYYSVGIEDIKWSTTGSKTVDFEIQDWGISALKTGAILLEDNS